MDRCRFSGIFFWRLYGYLVKEIMKYLTILQVRKWIFISSLLNVIAFIVFYIAKYTDVLLILYFTIFILVFNAILSLYFFIKIKKDRRLQKKLEDYKRVIRQFYFRFFFMLFFICYSVLVLVKILQF